MGIANTLARIVGLKPKAAPKPKGRRKAESYRGYRRNAVYGRTAKGNTPLDLRRAIRGVAAALATQGHVPTRAQLADLARQVEASRP